MPDLNDHISALPDRSLLVLDDDAPLRTRLGRALEQRGFEVTLASGVAEALSAVRAHPPASAALATSGASAAKPRAPKSLA